MARSVYCSVVTIKLPITICSSKDHQLSSPKRQVTFLLTSLLGSLLFLPWPTPKHGCYLFRRRRMDRCMDKAFEDTTHRAPPFGIVPMSANLLAKVTGGLCDDLLTNVIRAWDVKRVIISASAMNQMMWQNPITAKEVAILAKEWGQR